MIPITNHEPCVRLLVFFSRQEARDRTLTVVRNFVFQNLPLIERSLKYA